MSKLGPTVLIMSGVESSNYFDIAMSAGIRNVLMSFLYMQRKGKKFLQEKLEAYPDVKIMVDSGAYSFLTKEEYENKPLDYWETYLQKYTKFLRENKEHILSCVELDIAKLVGAKKVNEWRNKYFKPLEEEGILVCYVWHEEDGRDAWKEMCRKHDYVGLSLATNSYSDIELTKMFNTAKTYNTAVHGFAITDIALLTKMPFATVDSTTWLVGTKYGELNWFDGRKWTRLKKDKWKRQFKTKFIQLGAKWSLLEKENPYEMIRVNLLVFKEAEKHIQQRLRSKMYWLKGGESKVSKPKETPKKLVKVGKLNVVGKVEEIPVLQLEHEIFPKKPVKKLNVKKGVPDREDLQGKSKFEEFAETLEDSPATKTLDDIPFPSLSWFKTDCKEYLEFAKEFKLDTSLEKEDLLDELWVITVFIHHFDRITDMSDEIYLDDSEIDDLYAAHFDDDEEDIEIKRNKLRSKFIDKLLESSDVPERAKEREDYLDEEEYYVKELTEEEIDTMLPAIPEVDMYDAELREYGIQVVRDSKGKFLKGQQAIRKPKNIYSDKFPKLSCTTCYKGSDCPEYREGYVCRFDKLFKRFDTRNTEDVLDAMQSMANFNLERMQIMMMFERMDGGMVDANVSALIAQNITLLDRIKNLSRADFAAQRRETINPDGTRVVETEVRGNPQKGSILEKIFMGNHNDANDDFDKE